MSISVRDPPYVIFEVFDDNLLKFRGEKSLSECVTDWLNIQFDKPPFVLSPLHTPEKGKSHIHGIIELTNIDFDYFSNTFKAFGLPRPELCDNIIGSELYLTHDTATSRKEDKQTFSVADRQTMVFANGYKMHELTARSKADETSKIVAYVSRKLYAYIKEKMHFDTDDLYALVMSPDFYSELECSLPFDKVVSKGMNEVKQNYRFYEKIGSDVRKKGDCQPRTDEKEKFCHFIISNCCKDKQPFLLQQIHYACWCNIPQYRELMAKSGNPHSSYAINLRMAVNAFKTYSPHMDLLYKQFLEIMETKRSN